MKQSILIILLLMTWSNVYSQSGYYATDTATYIGVKIIDQGAIQNAKTCVVIIENEKIIFTPDEIVEYGFHEGNSYYSKEIDINGLTKKVFLERKSTGDINVYYFKSRKGRRFFIEKPDDKLIELEASSQRNKFNDELDSHLDKSLYLSNYIPFVNYNTTSLTRFFDLYNSGGTKPFPFFRYGVNTGVAVSHITNADEINQLVNDLYFDRDYSYQIGAFMDIPPFNGLISFHPEIYLQQNGFSNHSENGNIFYDMIINTTSINLPVLIRYTYPSVKLRPFVNAGLSFSYNLKNDSYIYTSTFSGDIIEIGKLEDIEISSSKLLGYSVGIGFEYNLNIRNSLFVELRYNDLFGIGSAKEKRHDIQLFIGINL